MPTRPTARLGELTMLIDGKSVPSESGETFASVDPYTESEWARIPLATAADVERAVAAASSAFEGPWARMSERDRARLLRQLAQVIGEHAEELAALESRDNGKLYREMIGQVRGLSDWYEYFAGATDKFSGDVIASGKPNFLVYTLHEPVGVVAGILPWNSPLLLLTFKLAPALATGCTFVAKPAEQASVSILRFAELVMEAGFPPGVFNVVTGAAATGVQLVGSPRVDKVAFTGSTAVGAEVASRAGANITRVTLELGGKSPQIVFADADLDAAANGVIAGVFAAGGQTCVAGSRLILHADIADALLDRIDERIARLRLGDPFDEETELGPLAFEEHLHRVQGFVEQARAAGANVRSPLVSNGLPSQGYFMAPALITGIEADAPVACEEVFGPVAVAHRFGDEEEAIALANHTRYGLAAGIWTTNVQRAHRVVKRLRAGNVWVNAYRTLSYSVPFGGFKASGLGRENGMEALRQYTETKSVWVELSGETRDPFVLG